MSNQYTFQSDLSDENRFGIYLDKVYPSIQGLAKRFNFSRKDDLESQHLGIDLILTDKKSAKEIYVDEKAQLHYLNKSLATFTFELSYLKNGEWRKGWFYDEKKLTQTYFLLTSIQTDRDNNFISCRLITVNRAYLQTFLEENGLTESRVFEYERQFREDTTRYNGEQLIEEIDSSFATFHCSFSNLREQPINLKIRLDALLEHSLGYEFLPCKIKKY
ncbi:MAG: hypothetical protein K0U38_05500 [Epsilonproteobacteria bacterium]|nr:hypothetical protein [Campylobacterota bacterium]